MSAIRSGKRKPSRINHSPTKAKQNWIYDLAQAAELYQVHQNTVRNWVKKGLPCLRDRRECLIRGADLNAFHKQRRERRQFPGDPGELYCPRCKQRHSLVGHGVSFRWKNLMAGLLDWECPNCRKPNSTHMRRLRLEGLILAGANLSSDIHD